MAFCVSSGPAKFPVDYTYMQSHRIFEMQVFICELVEIFSFALPQDSPVSIGFATGLLPIMLNGKKGAPLCVERVFYGISFEMNGIPSILKPCRVVFSLPTKRPQKLN
jgi:hypothetical protein